MSAQAVMEANPPIYFDRNLCSMIFIAHGNNIGVMLASWAYSPLEYDFPGGDFMTEPFRQAAVVEQNQVMATIASDLDVPYYDFVNDMPHDMQYWIDGLHVNEAGARIQAERFAAFIVESGLLP
jgi:lysophospholipase L1-like esterase